MPATLCVELLSRRSIYSCNYIWRSAQCIPMHSWGKTCPQILTEVWIKYSLWIARWFVSCIVEKFHTQYIVTCSCHLWVIFHSGMSISDHIFALSRSFPHILATKDELAAVSITTLMLLLQSPLVFQIWLLQLYFLIFLRLNLVDFSAVPFLMHQLSSTHQNFLTSFLFWHLFMTRN
jgi:hypothetical protein